SLCAAMEEGDRDKAFRAAHTLKGVSGSLSLERLFSSASRLTELLRPEAEAIPTSAHSLFEEVQRDYRLAVQVIRSYSASWGPEGGPCPPPNGFDQLGCSLHDS
ncbi:MAG: Hpt domain-containing protein, partial [Candidatus Ventricola sp.]|nr:Hpt domain-containing protein [Candidatus Ventricola sp.]